MDLERRLASEEARRIMAEEQLESLQKYMTQVRAVCAEKQGGGEGGRVRLCNCPLLGHGEWRAASPLPQ